MEKLFHRKKFTEAARLFNVAYPDNSVDRIYYRRLVENFTTTFSVKDNTRSDRPSVTAEDIQVAILGHFEINRRQPVCSFSRYVDILKSS